MAAKFRSGWITIVGGVIVVFVLMIINHQLNKPKSTSAKPFFTIGIQDNPISSLLIIASEEKFFAAQGVNVQLLSYPSGKLALEALLGYKIDLATASDIPILVHAFRNPNFSVIATINQSASRAEVVVRKNRGIFAPKNLVGRRIATQENSGVDYYTYLFLEHYNIPVNSVQLVYMPASKLVLALRSGYVEAFVMRSPYTEEAARYLPGQIRYFRVPNLYQVRFNLVATNSEIKKNSTSIKKVLVALRLAQAFERAHPVKAQKDVIRFFGVQRRDEVLSLWPHYKFTVSLDKKLLASMRHQSRWVIRAGKGDPSMEPDLQKLVDHRLLEEALEVPINPAVKLAIKPAITPLLTPPPKTPVTSG